MMRNELLEEITQAYQEQLNVWRLARENYAALAKTERRSITIGDFEIFLQHNPARAVSTGAKTDAASIAKRACFLCSKNRPDEQMVRDLDNGYDLLVNPYPIFPIHFTIPSQEHRKQGVWPYEMVEFAVSMPGVCAFFNGAKAGASLPDHEHFQAVLTEELPLMRRVMQKHPWNEPGITSSWEIDPGFPYLYHTAVVSPHDEEDVNLLQMMHKLGVRDPETSQLTQDLMNTFIWLGDHNELRIVAVPRLRHRPEAYFKEGEEHIMCSPGAVDVTGVLILPRKEDFDKLTESDVRKILEQTCCPNVEPA